MVKYHSPRINQQHRRCARGGGGGRIPTTKLKFFLKADDARYAMPSPRKIPDFELDQRVYAPKSRARLYPKSGQTHMA